MNARRALLRTLLLAALPLVLAPAAALAAPAWLDPVTLGGADTSDAPDVTAAGEGNAATVWLDGARTESNRVLASFRPRGGPWGAPDDLDPAGGVGSERPLVAALPNGELVAVWLGTGGEAVSEQLRWARRSVDGAWSDADFLASGCCESLLDLVVGGDGSATILWTDEGSPITNTLPPGADQWGSGESLPGGRSEPALAVAGNGTAVAVWDSFNCETAGCVEAAFKPAGGSWSGGQIVDSSSREIAGLDVVARPGDAFTAAWAERLATGGPTRGQITFGEVNSSDRSAGPGGGWQTQPDVVSTQLGGPPGCRFANFGCLDLTAAGDGRLAVLYQETGGTPNPSSVTAALRPAGGAWDDPENAGDAGSGDAFPHADFTRDGVVFAAWIADAPGGPVARASHRPPSGGWSPRDLDGAADVSKQLEDVAPDAEGNGVTAFRDGNEVRAAGFDGAAPRFSAFSLPAGGQAGDSLSFTAAADDAWSGVKGIGWSFGDGGGASGGTVSHAYGAGGDYAVTAKATDGVGNEASRTGSVSVSQAPTVTPTPVPTAVACTGDVDADGICDGIDTSNGATRPIPFKTATVRVISGEVFLKLPAGAASARASAAQSRGFTRLIGAATIPLGTTLDTKNGRVELRTAASLRRTQSGQFFDGVFAVKQRRKTPWGRGVRPLGINTELILTGGSFANCGTSSAPASASARSKRRVRRLWGDGKGRFRTAGRHAAATVRGTRWLVEDRCNGTFVRVSDGQVKVRDLIRGRTVVVRAGRSYFARLPR